MINAFGWYYVAKWIKSNKGNLKYGKSKLNRDILWRYELYKYGIRVTIHYDFSNQILYKYRYKKYWM